MDETRLNEIEKHLIWMSHQTAVAGLDLEVGVKGALELLAEVRRLREE